ncbi:MAG: NAD(+)/NADH kinase [Archaeoglobus sp.]|nr:NAD(+)/NADH kinase [Archaeoglobus sp.]
MEGKKLEKIGLVINPKAGRGIDSELVKSVVERLSPLEVFCSEIGEGLIKGLGGSKINLVEIDYKGNYEDTIKLVEELNKLDLDAVVVFGGDGTMSDASISKHPLLCLPTGTTNVSPLIFNDSPTFSIEEIEPQKFTRKQIGGLVVRVDDLSFNAFNDVVVGSTILSTVNGKKTQVDAELFLKGEKVESKPKKFKARVEIAKDGEILKMTAGIFGNIFVSPTSERYLGKGITGGAAISTFAGFKAVVACTSEGMIYRYSKEGLREVEPFVTTSLSFDEGETVRIHADEVISRDGTPIKRFRHAEVEYRENLVEVLKVRG